MCIRDRVNIGLALKECVRPGDIVTRIGGDEFAILLKNVNTENVNLVTRRIRETIEHYNFDIDIGDSSTVVTTSMGVAIVRPNEEVSSLYKRANLALYKSKERGRNCLTTACPDTEPELENHLNESAQENNLISMLPTDTLPGFDDVSQSGV